MKKGLSFLLCIVLITTCISPAFAFPSSPQEAWDNLQNAWNTLREAKMATARPETSIISAYSKREAVDSSDAKRGKSIGITKTEFVERYRAVPSYIVGSLTDINFINVGVQDYRQIYYAEPIPKVSFALHCEDTTDEVFAAMIVIDLTLFEDSYSIGMELGKFIVESIARMMYATAPDIQPEQVEAFIQSIDKENYSNFEESVVIGNVEHVYQAQDYVITYGFKSAQTFESEEAFLQYREGTLNSNSSTMPTGSPSASPTATPTTTPATDSITNSFDLSNLSFESLVELQKQVLMAMWESDEWQEVIVPSGIYEVGLDIPAGRWVISAHDGYSYVEWLSKMAEYDSDEYFTSLLGTAELDDGTSDYLYTSLATESVVYTLTEGTFLRISYGDVKFTTGEGSSLGFKF